MNKEYGKDFKELSKEDKDKLFDMSNMNYENSKKMSDEFNEKVKKNEIHEKIPTNEISIKKISKEYNSK